MEDRTKGFSGRRIPGPLGLGFVLAIVGFCLLISPAEMVPSSAASPSNMTNIAEALLRNMDHTVDPCNNFYMHACRNYLNTTKFPEGLGIPNNLSLMLFNIKKQLNESLSGIEKSKSKAYKLVRTYYKTCMEADKTAEDGMKRVVNMMKSMGGWPVLNNTWNETDFNLWNATYKLRQLGFPSNQLITFDVTDPENIRKHRLAVSPGLQRLSIRELLGGQKTKSVVQGYLQFMERIAKEFGANGNHIANDSLQVLHFQQQLANISDFCDSSEDFAQMSINMLNEEFPDIPWLEFMKNHLPRSLTVGDDEVVEVECINYFKELESLLAKTPARTLANFIMWRIAHDSSTILNKQLREYNKILESARKNRVQNLERWHECVYVADDLNKALGSIFIREHYDTESQSKVIEMTKRIKETFINILQQNKWMDSSTKENILAKVKNITSRIGFPEELIDDNKLDKYYDGLELSGDSFLENALKVHKFNEDKNYGKLRESFNVTEWNDFDALITGIAYDPDVPALEVFSGIIGDVFFQKDRPAYMNYGALGTAIASKIHSLYEYATISLDKKGGNTIQFSNSTMAMHNERIQCMLDRFTNYTLQKTEIKTNMTFPDYEIFPKTKGLKLAYTAYNQWVKENGEEAELPGMKQTPRQLFWLSFANTFCTQYKNVSTTETGIFSNLLKPAELFINGQISMISEFAVDYNCTIGSEMNPADKCDLS